LTLAIPEFANLPRSLYATLAVAVLSLLLWLILRPTRWRSAAGWFALAVAGQACSLQLIEAGSNIRLQLFYGWQDLLQTWRMVFLFALLGQTVIVMLGARRLWLPARTYLPRLATWPWWLLFVALNLYGIVKVVPTVVQALVEGGSARQAAVQSTKVALGLWIAAVGLLNVALAAAAVPSDFLHRALVRWQQAQRRWLPWAAAAWVVGVSSLLAWVALDAMPHVPDEVAYLYHAKYLAGGRLTLDVPVERGPLNCPFYFQDGTRWYLTPPAGWPMVLALGFWIGAPWLINPLLGGAAILLTHLWLRTLYDRDTADLAVLLLAFSPWMLFMSASLLTHPATLVFALLGFVGVTLARERGSIAWAAVAGLGIGAMLHVRPLDAVLAAIAAGAWWLAGGWRKLRWPALAATVATGLLMTALVLAYNRHLTGNPFVFPINHTIDLERFPGANRLGFGPDVGSFGWIDLDPLPGHGPIDVVVNTNYCLYMVQFDLFGWAGGSLLFALLVLALGRLRRDPLMWLVVFTFIAGLNLYWFSGVSDFGARYWYVLLPAFVALTLSGVRWFIERLRHQGAPGDAGLRMWTFVVLASLAGFVNQLPWRTLDKYHHYRGIRPDFRQLLREHNFGRSLVFIRGPWWPDYASAFPFNPPRLDPDAPGPLFLHDLGPDSNRRVVAAYPDRPVWLVEGWRVTKSSARVAAGPLPPGSLPPP
jgi:hypothetical protein